MIRDPGHDAVECTVNMDLMAGGHCRSMPDGAWNVDLASRECRVDGRGQRRRRAGPMHGGAPRPHEQVT
jgi:hypothetical protein